MNNSQRLLYILPDLAYVVELLPTKKPHSYTIHNFRQINGQFLDDNEFIEKNLEKLVDKLGDGEYQLVLPDFLFTNTILNIRESSKENVNAYLEEKLYPNLDISKDTHEINPVILTEHRGVFKVQLAALEKTVLEPLRTVLKGKSISISSVVAVSWTIKSIVSLEPSVSIVQLGDSLYLAQHYIGIDQTTFTPVADAENLIETVKTLKGAEPSLQTIYLLSSGLVEEQLKAGLTKTLPLQQLAIFKETEVEMPSYVKQAMEAAAKTLSIPDYAVPTFPLGESVGAMVSEEPEEKSSEHLSVPTPVVLGDEIPSKDVSLPAPMVATAGSINATEVISNTEEESLKEEKVEQEMPVPTTIKETLKEENTEKIEPVAVEKPTDVDQPIKVVTTTTTEVSKPETLPSNSPVDVAAVAAAVTVEAVTEDKKVEELSTEKIEDKPEVTKEPDPVDSLIGQFATDAPVKEKEEVAPKEVPVIEAKQNKQPVAKQEKKVIKDKSGVSPMLKMFFIGLVSFFATVGIGVGLGLGFLSLSNNDTQQATSQDADATPSPTIVAASPTPTPLPEIVKTEYSLLVVNATTKAGYAGEMATKLEDGGFESVDAGNAKGDYEEGNYLLVGEETENSKALLNAVEEDTGLDFELEDDKSVEDPKEAYDAVVVLAE